MFKELRNLSYCTMMLLISTFVFSVCFGINAVSLSFVLYKYDVSTSLIGISRSFEIVSGVVMAKFMYDLTCKVGVLRLFTILSIAQAIVILILPNVLEIRHGFLVWLILSCVVGICLFGIVTLRQSWINIMATSQNRSTLVSLSSTMICLGFITGPVIVKIVGAGEYLVFMISALLVLFSCLLLFLVDYHQPRLVKTKINYLQIIRHNKDTFMARFFLEAQVISTVLMAVIYGVKNNLSAEDAGILVGVFMGVGIFDIFIGLLIKNKDLQKYINFGFVGCILAVLVIPFAIGNYFYALLIFIVYGWFKSLLFITLITKVNQDNVGQDLIAINSAFQAFAWLGALVGTLCVGFAMQIFDKNGFIVVIFLANVCYFTYHFFLAKKCVS